MTKPPWYQRWRMSPLAQVLWVALGDPSAWKQGVTGHTIIHIRSKLELWIANEAYGFDFRPEKSLFTKYEKKVLYKQCKYMHVNDILVKLTLGID